MRAAVELIGAGVLAGLAAYGAYKFLELMETKTSNKGKDKR